MPILPSPSRTLDRPWRSPAATRVSVNESKVERFILYFFWIHILHTHCYVVLPDHPPEVNDGVRQRALRRNVGLWAVHALSRESTTGQRGCRGRVSQPRATQGDAVLKRTHLCFYLDEVSVDIICVLIGGFQPQFHPAVVNWGAREKEEEDTY